VEYVTILEYEKGQASDIALSTAMRDKTESDDMIVKHVNDSRIDAGQSSDMRDFVARMRSEIQREEYRMDTWDDLILMVQRARIFWMMMQRERKTIDTVNKDSSE